MIQIPKTTKAIDSLVSTMNKELQEAVDLRAAEERLVAMRQHEQDLEQHLTAYERHKLWSSIEEIEGDDREAALERNNRIVSTIIALIDYVKAHPKCTADDLVRLGLPLPSVMDPAALIMIVRCSKIVEKYDQHKPRLMSSVWALVKGAPAEG